MTRKNLLVSVGVLVSALFTVLLIGWWQVDGPGAGPSRKAQPLPLSQMNFQMTNQDGQTVEPKTLLGNASMVFFGFTYCPDICPTTLIDISGWLDALGAEASNINVAFITVDPERDTVDLMADYVGNFHPAIQGWTGSMDQTRKTAEAFRANYEKIALDAGDYTMNHTASVFLFDAAGRFSGTIDYHEPREYAVPKIRRVLKKVN